MAELNSLNNIYDSLTIYYEKHGRKWQTFLHHPKIHTYILKFKQQLDHNPLLEVVMLFVIASLLMPILLFVVFAVIIATIAFVSFMLIQVTILVIVASILSCVFFCIASTFVAIVLCATIAAFTIST